MKKIKTLMSLFISFQLITTNYACEALSFVDSKKDIWMSKDFMYDFGAGRVFINQRNVQKTSFSLAWKRAKWQSKYASVTFNQPARDFPFGGMNEKGLGMEILWHNAEFPTDGTGHVINESQLIQYVLDMSATTEEAIDLIKSVHIKRIYAYVHYMICDTTNDCRVIEYLDGKINISEMPEDIFRHLGNENYQTELANLKILKQNYNSAYIARFKEMNDRLDDSDDNIAKSIFAFYDRTNGLHENTWSKWNISYNLTQQKIWFRSYLNRDVKFIDLNDYEKECDREKSEYSVSINTSIEDFMFTHFTKEQNIEMINTYDYIPEYIRNFGEFYSRFVHKCKN